MLHAEYFAYTQERKWNKKESFFFIFFLHFTFISPWRKSLYLLVSLPPSDEIKKKSLFAKEKGRKLFYLDLKHKTSSITSM